MFNPFRRPDSVCVASNERAEDPIKQRVEDARYLAEQLVREHVRCNGLHKIDKAVVRNAMTYAHAMSLAAESYERELRAEAFKKAAAETAFTPEERACDE
jgi:hypothetical protein